MREIGLLFTPDNRALVRLRRKWETRRIMKPQPEKWDVKATCRTAWAFKLKDGTYQDIERDGCGRVRACCPYGNPQAEPVAYYVKERVWVTHIDDNDINQITARILYSAEGIYRESREVVLTPGDYYRLVSRRDWRKPSSPMFMIRSFARTWLPGVRTWPERLGEMSAEDAIAEGIELDPSVVVTPGDFDEMKSWEFSQVWRDYLNGGYDLSPFQSYASLWNSINKAHPWHPDLWTWAIEWESKS